MGEPLTPEERSQIAAAIVRTQNQWDGGHRELKLAMRGEAYWREVVKSLDPIFGGNEGDSSGCLFCEYNPMTEKHADGCPWLLAQEPV